MFVVLLCLPNTYWSALHHLWPNQLRSSRGRNTGRCPFGTCSWVVPGAPSWLYIIEFISCFLSPPNSYCKIIDLKQVIPSSAPSSSPLGVQVQQTDNPGELFVSWIPPTRETHNGALQGYHVKAVPRINGETGKPTIIIRKYSAFYLHLSSLKFIKR